MNKVNLIKSFAGYPVWEYQLEWNYYSMEKDLQSSWPTKYHQIHKDIVERFKDNFEEVKERPTSWEELWEIKWYFIGMDSDIGKTDGIFYSADSNKNIFLTKQQCEASLALAQITQLLAKYDIPEESDIRYNKKSSTATSWLVKRSKLLEFDTEEKCSHFYKHHADLISKLAPFYIF